jgi:predicted NUDIX family NTP pyrophosphohydrolase
MRKAKVIPVLQYGAIPYRVRRGKLECLLVTAKNSKRWIIPKGNPEPYLKPHEVASIEAREEAGVYGRISRSSLGVWKNNRQNGAMSVKAYPLEVRHVFDEWLEKNQRQRRWFTLHQAIYTVEEESLRDLIAHLPGFLYNQGHPLSISKQLITSA